VYWYSKRVERLVVAVDDDDNDGDADWYIWCSVSKCI
jgi:hypothetical protein